MRRPNVLEFALIVAMILFTGSAIEADPKNLNHLLRGDYAFSGETSCLVSDGPFGPPAAPGNPPGGFDPDLTPFDPPAPFPRVISFTVHGVRTFNGDGTGTLVGRSVGFGHPRALPTVPPFFDRGGAFSTDFQADFTYEVFPDRTFTVLSPVTNTTSLTGLRAGQTSTSGPTAAVGQISRDGKTLTTVTDTPTVETVGFADGDVQKRICHRSRIHLKLKTDSERDD